VLSSESAATGLGSGVANLHLDTLLQILKSDATNLEETLTSDLLDSILRVNVQKGIWHDPGFGHAS
jgi:phage gp29-like protein